MSNISMRKKEKKVSKKIGTFDFSMFDSRRLTDKICQKTNTSSLIRIVLMTAAGMSGGIERDRNSQYMVDDNI
jgi:hypothetical protein